MRTAARLAVVLREPEGHLSLTEIELSGQDLVSTSRQLVDSRLAKYRSLKSWSLIGSTAASILVPFKVAMAVLRWTIKVMLLLLALAVLVFPLNGARMRAQFCVADV